MANIEINDLNEEITISEEEIKHVNGGAGYIKFDGVDGEASFFNKSTPILSFKTTPQLDSGYGFKR